MPLTDFQFTMSLSHDIPLTTSHGHCLYVLGSIQRTGEKLLLQYNTKHGNIERGRKDKINPNPNSDLSDIRFLVWASSYSD